MKKNDAFLVTIMHKIFLLVLYPKNRRTQMMYRWLRCNIHLKRHILPRNNSMSLQEFYANFKQNLNHFVRGRRLYVNC